MDKSKDIFTNTEGNDYSIVTVTSNLGFMCLNSLFIVNSTTHITSIVWKLYYIVCFSFHTTNIRPSFYYSNVFGASLTDPPKGESQSNGAAEEGGKTVR